MAYRKFFVLWPREVEGQWVWLETVFARGSFRLFNRGHRGMDFYLPETVVRETMERSQ